MLSSVVSNYVDAAIEQLRRKELMRSPGKLPEAMRDPNIAPSNGWTGWKPIASTVMGKDLDELEREIGLKFPPLYREFLQYRHFVDLTETGLRFEQHKSDSWGDTLRSAFRAPWTEKRVSELGFIPFGSETFMDAGPVCFDTRTRTPDGDCPVVILDHEWIGTEQEIRPMFSSSAKMFECLTLVATNDLGFFYHSERSDASALPRKRELCATFLALDPTGAGGPGREYWTSWGVEPAE